MSSLKPKLFSVMKTYTKEQFAKDIVSGIIVAIIALPLSIALAIASGVEPVQGIYTAIVAGFIVSFLGGSRVQISGPTAAFATIVAGIALSGEDGMTKLVIATVMAGIILILMGVFKLGTLIKFIPFTITTGFTAGIAVTLLVGQLKDFFGLRFETVKPDGALIETLDKLKYFILNITEFSWQSFVVGAVSLLILILWPMIKRPKFITKIPASLIAVIVGIVLVKACGWNYDVVRTIANPDNPISSSLPPFVIPDILPALNVSTIVGLVPTAFTIAILAAIESLLSCVVSDSMVNSRHNSNMELVALGTGNIFSAMFGGIPATGAIARTAANVKNGGRTPVAGMVHAITLLIVLVVLMPLAGLIPMPTIAAILFMVAYNMSGWRTFVRLCKTAPKSDIIVLFATFLLTVIFDLVVAIEVGMVLTCILFIKRMSEVTLVQGWKLVDDENDPDSITLRQVPKHTMVYEISGPMFFGAADKILGITVSEDMTNLVLRMRSVNAIDSTATNALLSLHENCKKNNVRLILSHVNEQPMNIMEKAGLVEKIGRENFCSHIDEALKRAEEN